MAGIDARSATLPIGDAPSATPASGAAAPGRYTSTRPPADWRACLPESHRPRLQAWFWTIAAMTFATIIIGGVTRLTQSGLSIVDWQPLIGIVPPLTEPHWSDAFDRYRQFPEYRQLRPDMTLAEFKVIFFWEYLHRLVARSIGLVFLLPFVLFWRGGYLPRPLLVRTLGLFTLGAMQGGLGWLMVRSGLVDRPSVSHYRLAAHLGLALVILGFSIWLARDVALRRPAMTGEGRGRSPGLPALMIIGLLLAAQIVWGAFVAGLKGGLIYNTFPLMAGQLLPPAGLAFEPVLLNFVGNIATVQWMHRVIGTLLLAATAALYLRMRRGAHREASRRFNVAFAALVALQFLLGVLTLVLRVPVTLGVLHQATAAGIVAVWVAWLHHERHGQLAFQPESPPPSTSPIPPAPGGRTTS
jgi:cytochrome c oxidase assembly protein subunit 15